MQDSHWTGARGSYTRGYLPHRDYDRLIQMITFRLADALPERLVEPGSSDLATLDEQLGRGHGGCVLGRPHVARLVADALRYFAGERYDLGPWVVMPNHVHVIIRPRGHALASIVHSWNSFTAKRICALVGGRGNVWQREYFDQAIWSSSHLSAAARYLEQNPVCAGLVARAQDWEFGSARDPRGGAVRGGAVR